MLLSNKYSIHYIVLQQEPTELVVPISTHLGPIVHISTILLSKHYRFPTAEQSRIVARQFYQPRSGLTIWNGTLPAGCVIVIIIIFLNLSHQHYHHNQQTSHTTATKITPTIIIIIQPHHHHQLQCAVMYNVSLALVSCFYSRNFTAQCIEWSLLHHLCKNTSQS